VSNAEYCTAEQSILQLYDLKSIFEESILPQLAKFSIIFGAQSFIAIFTIAHKWTLFEDRLILFKIF